MNVARGCDRATISETEPRGPESFPCVYYTKTLWFPASALGPAPSVLSAAPGQTHRRSKRQWGKAQTGVEIRVDRQRFEGGRKRRRRIEPLRRKLETIEHRGFGE
jgi:hypothetical protein